MAKVEVVGQVVAEKEGLGDAEHPGVVPPR